MSLTSHGHHIPYTALQPNDFLTEVLECGGPTECDQCGAEAIAFYHYNSQLITLSRLFRDAKAGATPTEFIPTVNEINLVMPVYDQSGRDKVGTVSRFVMGPKGLEAVMDLPSNEGPL